MAKRKSGVEKRSSCPIAAALDLIGDKWSLLIIRDIALFDKHKNKEFQEAGEGIPTNILADRLKKLTANGLIEKREYQNNPPRFEYFLTEAGKGLIPVTKSIAKWGAANLEDVRMPG